MGLVAPWHVESSWTRARTRVPCIGRQILNHCATREVHIIWTFNAACQSQYFSIHFPTSLKYSYLLLFPQISKPSSTIFTLSYWLSEHGFHSLPQSVLTTCHHFFTAACYYGWTVPLLSKDGIYICKLYSIIFSKIRRTCFQQFSPPSSILMISFSLLGHSYQCKNIPVLSHFYKKFLTSPSLAFAAKLPARV